MKKTTYLTLLTAVLISVGAAAASHNKMVYVDQYDLNDDASVTLAEFDQARRAKFDRIDESNDGIISEREYVFEYKNRLDGQLQTDRVGQVKQTKIRFKSLDKDQNAQMVWQEYDRSGSSHFERFDTNGDNVIDDNDTQATKTWGSNKDKKQQTPQQISAKRAAKLRWAKTALRMPTTHSYKGFMTIYDADSDNRVTLKDYTARRRAAFDVTDSNDDDWISEDEYLFEYENRVDRQVQRTRKNAIKQTYVRFSVLDKDENGQMTFAEFQRSGHRSFKRLDTNNDGAVNSDDPMPKKRKHKKHDKKKHSKKSDY